MTTTTTAREYACTVCHATGRWTDYSWRGASVGPCPSCKGRRVVAAAQWLRQVRADARATLTRRDAIAWAAEAIGMDATGGVAYGKDRVGQCDHPLNGVAGLVVDLEDHGHADVLERFLAAYARYASPSAQAELADLLPLVRLARVEAKTAPSRLPALPKRPSRQERAEAARLARETARTITEWA